MNATFAVCLGLTAIALIVSLLRGPATFAPSPRRPDDRRRTPHWRAYHAGARPTPVAPRPARLAGLANPRQRRLGPGKPKGHFDGAVLVNGR